MAVLRRVLFAAVLAGCALGFFSPAARADGDPGSDVLVYQNLFVAADANMPVAQQVELDNLLTSAAGRGFPVRVAVIAQRDDLGAITALWGKPAAYAGFLGTELSLAYTGRLLVVMPDGFGFYWQEHPVAAANQLLTGQRVGTGGDALATAAEDAVRALAAAAGVRLKATSATSATGATAGAGAGAAPKGTATPAGNQARPASSDAPVVIAVAATLLVVAIGAAGIVLGRRTGLRLPRPAALRGRLARRPRLVISGTWLVGGLVGLAVVAIALHAVIQPSTSAAQSSNTGQMSALPDNANLDPGTTLSQAAPDFTLTDQFGQPVSLRSYRGKVVILAFNDSECTTVCPLTTAALVDAKNMLGAAASQVELLGIDANPKAVSVEDVRSYSQLPGCSTSGAT